MSPTTTHYQHLYSQIHGYPEEILVNECLVSGERNSYSQKYQQYEGISIFPVKKERSLV
ncbi:hypothetical protein JCM9157_2056 [Halalkalibacter akibai JCM 9157]|uniref:Uncharacterized protein n=1 Tax=Halalkalibacter akibai (strain ATCC 43226 / DSM 21942 / CIP 109018 / JCM 9157 / 1139) TaxID=1236973 RepID=W4QTP0_HALA3|nr:hypothetical protein JCM9157_2056 [Halalkalibacter akibai JCM 9157]